MSSYRGFSDALIPRPEESYRLWCVVVCDLETSRMMWPWPALGRSATGEKKSPWVRSCKHGYYVSSWATIRFSGRTLLHGVCCEKCTLLILPFVWRMDDHTVFQELIFILYIYLSIYLFTSHVLYQSHYVLPQYLPATPRPSPSSLYQTNSIIWSIRPVTVGVLVSSTIDAQLCFRPPRVGNRARETSKRGKTRATTQSSTPPATAR